MKAGRRSLSLTQLCCLFGGRREIQLIMIFFFPSEKETCCGFCIAYCQYQEAARPVGNGSPSSGRLWLDFKLAGKKEGSWTNHDGHKSSSQYWESSPFGKSAPLKQALVPLEVFCLAWTCSCIRHWVFFNCLVCLACLQNLQFSACVWVAVLYPCKHLCFPLGKEFVVVSHVC